MLPKIFGNSILILLTFICLNGLSQTQTDGKKQEQREHLKSLIDSKKFKFHALSATSQRGKTIQLNSEYFLKVNKDSLQVDLPYYGRSYMSDYPATNLSIQFNSNQFTYSADSAKKGGWQIIIQPKNENKASKIFMSVSANGYCTTQVTSNSRQPISFYGTIEDY